MKPRLVKEIQLAKKRFGRVVLISFLIENWTDAVHQDLCEKLDIEHYEIYATRKSFFSWFLASVLQRICVLIWPLFRKDLYISSFASNKRTLQLLMKLPVVKGNFNVVNGRNTATLLPLLRLNKSRKSRMAFDIEDYHPGENVSWTNPEYERQRRELLMKGILKNAALISVAGAPIKEKVTVLMGSVLKTDLLILNNSFLSSDFKLTEASNKNIVQFVWFSVDISRNRGLEGIIPLLDEFHKKVKLTLIGNLIPEFHANFLVKYGRILTFVEPMPQHDLHKLLCEFDVGLAVETNTLDINKQLAVSNKIFACSQAGLFVLATKTIGQLAFMEQHTWAGKIIDESSSDSVRLEIETIINSISKIRKEKQARFEAAKSLAWEHESYELLSRWEKINNEYE